MSIMNNTAYAIIRKLQAMRSTPLGNKQGLAIDSFLVDLALSQVKNYLKNNDEYLSNLSNSDPDDGDNIDIILTEEGINIQDGDNGWDGYDITEDDVLLITSVNVIPGDTTKILKQKVKAAIKQMQPLGD